jgi:DNA-binding CsgD family transcriptional regulator
VRLTNREQELDLLGDLFLEGVNGRGTATFISGPIGVGKTSLLLTATGRARADGARVLTAFAERSERTLPFGVMSHLFRQAPLEPAAADRVQRLLADGGRLALLHDSRSEAVQELVAPTLQGLSTTLLDVAERAPLVVAVDDVHHADAASLLGLTYLVRRMASSRIQLLVTLDPFAQSTYPELTSTFVRLPHCRELRLRLLDAEGTAALLRDQLSDALADRLAGRVHEISGGNPLLASALAEDQRSVPYSSTDGLVIGNTFAQAVLGCFYRGEPSMLQYARALAILGPSAPFDLRWRLAGLEPEVARWSEDLLSEAGLLCERSFRHPRIGSSVLGIMTPHERADLEKRAACLLYEYCAEAPVIAPHLAAGNLQAPWAVRVLQEASDLALSEGDLETALRHLLAARHACADQQQDTAIQLALNRVKWRIDPATAIYHLDCLTEAVQKGQLDGSQALEPVPYLLWHGRVDAAVALIDQLAAMPHLNEKAPTLPDLRSAIRWVQGMYPARSVPVMHQDRALEPYELASAPVDIASKVLPGDGGSELVDEASLVAARQYLRNAGTSADSAGQVVTALGVLVCHELLDEATEHCEVLLKVPANRTAPTMSALLTAIQAEIKLRQGHIVTAEAMATEAMQTIPSRGWGVAIALPIGTLVRAYIVSGKLRLAAEQLKIPVPTAMFESVPGLHYLYGRARYYLVTGQYAASLQDLEVCENLMTTWGVDAAGLVPWRVDKATACFRLGDEAQARVLLLDQLERLRPAQLRARGMTLRALAGISDVPRRPGLLKEAISLLRESGDRLELAHAFADMSQTLFALGDRGRARSMLRAAHHMARQCNALSLIRMLAASGQANDLTTAEPATQLTELSAAERRVASLAAMGHTNREIAGELYITVSTVEQHLTRVYRKLRVDRRNLPPGLHMDVADET